MPVQSGTAAVTCKTAAGSASSICVFEYAQTYADSLVISAMDAQTSAYR